MASKNDSETSSSENVHLSVIGIQPDSSMGHPLDDSTRASMEACFGVDLRGVRIHRDRGAIEAARRLNARAFTRGSNVYFGFGQYAPEKPDGRWLLAHELVHVIQQSCGQRAGSNSGQSVGNPHDFFEEEANFVADKILKSDRVSTITPDDSGMIRRAISIVPSSAQITLNSGGAKSAVTATSDGRKLVCNLTKGFNPADSLHNGSAFEATGRVDVLVDDEKDITSIERGAMRFAFIQIAKVHFAGLFWAGRKSSEGSVGMVVSQPPAWPQNQLISLDSESAISPFITPTKPNLSEQQQMGKTLLAITDIKMEDHPVFGGPLKMKNTKMVTDNFLFHLKEHVEYFTVLVARDNKGATTLLAHFRWDNDYDARVRWVGGNPVARQAGTITFDPPVQGAPTDAAISSLVANPAPPFANDLHKAADKSAVTGNNPGNFSLNPKWFLNVPSDFWT